jgi:hypothetical protein
VLLVYLDSPPVSRDADERIEKGIDREDEGTLNEIQEEGGTREYTPKAEREDTEKREGRVREGEEEEEGEEEAEGGGEGVSSTLTEEEEATLFDDNWRDSATGDGRRSGEDEEEDAEEEGEEDEEEREDEGDEEESRERVEGDREEEVVEDGTVSAIVKGDEEEEEEEEGQDEEERDAVQCALISVSVFPCAPSLSLSLSSPLCDACLERRGERKKCRLID